MIFNKLVNPSQLHNELEAVLGADLIGISTRPPDVVEVHVTENADTSGVEAAVNNHDRTVLTDEQKTQEASDILLRQGKLYLRKQLLDPNPNVDDIYTTFKTQVDGHTTLTTMVDNMTALVEVSMGWSLDLTTPTTVDKLRYVFICQLVISLLT